MDATKITIATVIEAAIDDTAERVATGRTMTASYQLEYEGQKYVVTVNPIDTIIYHAEARARIH